MNVKGQAALEYMLTYGWAILVIMIVGLALWQMGLFNPPNPTPGCHGFSQITVLDQKLNISASNGILTLVLSNDGGATMKIQSGGIDASIFDIDCSCYSGCSADPFRPGQTLRTTLTCNNLAATYASGDYYRAYINITYTNKASGITHTSSGVCWGTIE